MSPEVAAALARVKEAFAGYSKPVHVDFCHCNVCSCDEDMARLFAIPYDQLTPMDRRTVLWDAYWTWGDWPDLAFYVPRLLEFYAEDRRDFQDEDMLFYKLILASHPELYEDAATGGLSNYLTNPMRDERASVRELVQTAFLERLTQKSDGHGERVWVGHWIPDTLAFLAAFDVPLDSCLQQWRDSEVTLARANLCLFLADYTLNNKPPPYSLLKNTYLKRLIVLPENRVALDALLSPASVAGYLLGHASDAATLGPGWLTGVDAAFDCAMQQP